jgi:ATP-binding cassette subfamily B protein
VALFQANRALARRRAFWGTLLAALGTLGYYTAYAYIAWRTVRGDFSIGDLDLPRRQLPAPAPAAGRPVDRVSQVASQALYLDDLFSFFQIQPEIHSREGAVRVPQPIRRASCSRTSASATRMPNSGPCATSISSCRPAKCWPWSARTAPARPRW